MSGTGDNDVDIAKTLADLAKGEMTASALEKHLDALESKVEELLSVFENDEESHDEGPAQDQDVNQHHEGFKKEERSG